MPRLISGLLPLALTLALLPVAQSQHSAHRAAKGHKQTGNQKVKKPARMANADADEDADGTANASQSPLDMVTPLASSSTPDIKAASAILIDAVSGQVLYEKNADQPRPMASTTKIMTALLFCEHVPDETTLVKASKLASLTRESSLHLKAGEKVAAHDLLRAILMRSANDACVAAAEHVAGSVPNFADMMNARARQLGCTHTHFMNPHGLQSKQHYTSARDLALIARQAIQEPRISEVTRTLKCRITRSMDKLDVTMRNHAQKFLKSYPGADGIKTGWTIPAGHCFVGSATHKGWRLIAVVLKSPDFVKETSALMNYGFARFEPRVLARAGDSQGTCAVENGAPASIIAAAKQTVQVVVPKTTATAAQSGTPVTASPAPPAAQTPAHTDAQASVSTAAPSGGMVQSHISLRPQTAPLKAGTEVGTLEAQLDGKTICSTPLVATSDVAAIAQPALLAKNGGMGKTLLWAASIFVVAVVSLRYGKGITTTSKNARRRWRRLKKSMRGSYR